MKTQERTRRRRRAGSYPLQLAGAVILVTLATWVLVQIVIKATHPYLLGHDVGRKVAALREKLTEQRARNAALRARIGYLQSDEGAETLARRAGWRRPGELVLFLETRSDAAISGVQEAR